MTKQIDHTEYPKRLRGKSIAELKFIVQDAGEAEKCGGENAGYYADEVHYAAAELRRRNG